MLSLSDRGFFLTLCFFKEFEKVKKKKKMTKKEQKNQIDLKACKLMKIGPLRTLMQKKEIDHMGTKAVLIKRLEEYVKQEKSNRQNSEWKDEIEDNLVQLHGTKLASAVQYLKRLLKGGGTDADGKQTQKPKILIFSQFSNFLHNFADFLNENGVENVFIEGNVIRREQAITKFKNAEIQVMMLSLDNAASGTTHTSPASWTTFFIVN